MSDLSEYIFVWLIGYSALLGPIAGIMICDYFVIRRTKLDVEALYDPNGEYAGIRIAAIGALVLSVLPNVPGFLNVATGTAGTNNALFPAVFDEIYVYAWFVGITLAAVLYWIFKGCPLTGAKSA
jgi:NCS1 family nucleobase:cation symporter-1